MDLLSSYPDILGGGGLGCWNSNNGENKTDLRDNCWVEGERGRIGKYTDVENVGDKDNREGIAISLSYSIDRDKDLDRYEFDDENNGRSVCDHPWASAQL